MWHTLSPAEKQQWETDARRAKITGFNLWLRLHLNNLPYLKGLWRLDTITDSITVDSSKNNNHCTVFGATLAPGHFNQCLNFDGLDDYGNCGAGPSLNITDAITIEAWIKPTDTGAIMTIARKTGAYWIGIRKAFWTFFFYLPGVFNWAAAFGPNIFDGDWHYLVATYDRYAGAGNMHIYIDNVEPFPAETKTGSITTNAEPFTIGIRLPAGDQPYKNLMDDLRLHSRALPAAEIETHFERS